MVSKLLIQESLLILDLQVTEALCSLFYGLTYKIFLNFVLLLRFSFRIPLFWLPNVLFLADACLIDCSFCGADLRSAHLQVCIFITKSCTLLLYNPFLYYVMFWLPTVRYGLIKVPIASTRLVNILLLSYPFVNNSWR